MNNTEIKQELCENFTKYLINQGMLKEGYNYRFVVEAFLERETPKEHPVTGKLTTEEIQDKLFEVIKGLNK